MVVINYFIRLYAFLGIIVVGWTQKLALDDTELSGCVLYLSGRTWHEAMMECERNGEFLLCYKSREDIQRILDTFAIYKIQGILKMWLSSVNCHGIDVECLILNAHKNKDSWLPFFQQDCSLKLPFMCCHQSSDTTLSSPTNTNSTTSLTTISTFPSLSTFTTSTVTETRSKSISAKTTAIYSTRTHKTTTSTTASEGCNSVKRREVLWPDTPLGKTASRACPGNATGYATWYCSEVNRDWSISGPNMSQCRSVGLQKLKEEFNKMTANETVESLSSLYKEDQMLQGNDLRDSVTLISKLPEKLYQEISHMPQKVRYQAAMEAVNKTTSIFDKMITSPAWSDVSKKSLSEVGSELLSSVDNFGMMLGQMMTNTTTMQSIVKKNMMLQVMRDKGGQTLDFPGSDLVGVDEFGKNGSITLLDGYANEFDQKKGPVSVVYASYSDMSKIFTEDKTGILNSPVVSLSVGGRESLKPMAFHAKVHIQVVHLFENNDSACVFWNLNTNAWDNTGCHLLESNQTHSTCACDHLTNFAVLTDFQGITDVDSKPLFFITVIGCSLSIISLAICIAIFTCFRYQQTNAYVVRYSIHRNLCITLFLANVLLISGLKKTENEVSCAVIAGFLHYFFLSAFSWMLLEGVHIYILLVIVFASKRTHWEKYYLFGYGFPLIIVGITAISRPTSYGTTESCWLSTKNGSIWSFTGPVVCILLLNSAALILAQWKASKISVKNDHTATVKRWLRVTLILFPILGLTWIFGFFYVGELADVAAYIFAILNSLQGLCIFICHCVMDKKLRTMIGAAIKKKRATVQTDSTGSRRTLNNKSRARINSLSTISEEVNNKPASFKNRWAVRWNQMRKPWAFCFTLEMSNRTNSTTSENQDNLPKAIMLQWNNFSDTRPL